MRLVFSGNARHKRKIHQHGWRCWDGLPCPLNCPFLLPIILESPWHHPQWGGSAHQHLPGIFGSSWSRSCVIPAPSGCSFSTRQLWDMGNWGFQRVPPGKLSFRMQGSVPTAEREHWRPRFLFPEGFGHVWKGNGCLIRWLENLYHRSLQIHSSSPIERTTLQKMTLL